MGQHGKHELNNRDELIEDLRKALRELLESDGHHLDCRFKGCTCGRAESYKAARTAALRVVRLSN